MRTVKLNTGVVVTFDDKDNMKTVTSPYWIEPSTEFELTDAQMIKFKMIFFIILWVFIIYIFK